MDGGGGMGAVACPTPSTDLAWETLSNYTKVGEVNVVAFAGTTYRLFAVSPSELFRPLVQGSEVPPTPANLVWTVTSGWGGTGDGSNPPEVHAGKAPDNLWIITHGTTVTSPPNVPSPLLPPGVAIREAWANTPTDAWIVARPSNFYDGGLPEDPAFFHWDGVSWTSVATPASSTGDQRLWGSGAHDVWQTSTADFLLHWNGTVWSTVIPVGVSDPARHINVVWGSASNDVWAAGGDASGAKAWHFDGVSWAEAGPTHAGAFSQLWGTCAANFWLASGGDVFRYDGTTWSSVTLPGTSSGPIGGLTGLSQDDVWLDRGGKILHLRRGRCGDGIIQPDLENCDATSPFCTTCRQNTCLFCFGMQCAGNAAPCAGLAGAALTNCQGLVDCAAQNINTCGQFDRCLCSDSTCSAGANGPCAAQMEAVANSHDPAEVLRQVGDTTSTLYKVENSTICFQSQRNGICGEYCSTGAPFATLPLTMP
jgi:hypothetical protein